MALTPDGLNDPIFNGMPTVQRALQWHSVQVLEPPDGAVVLAASDVCPIQAMRVGRHAWSMQYHVEVEPDTVTNWGDVPAYRTALESTLGPTALVGAGGEGGRRIGRCWRRAGPQQGHRERTDRAEPGGASGGRGRALLGGGGADGDRRVWRSPHRHRLLEVR